MSAALLAACSTRPPSPIVDSRVVTPVPPREPVAPPPPAPVQVTPPIAAQPPMPVAPAVGAAPPDHIVKRGETMASIARQYGLNPADFARWNNWPFDVPLRDGQVLRLTPPPGMQAPITAAPLPPAQPPAPAGDVKREPKAVKVPFTDAAFARMQGGNPAPASAATGAPTKAAAPAPIGGAQAATLPPTTATTTPVAVAPTAPAPSGTNDADNITWAWPASGRVTKKFTETSLLRGVSIPAKVGTPVFAAANGRVTYNGELRGFGRLIIVRHNDQYTSVYAHLSQALVKEGDNVRRGQKIAETGDSDTDEAKLHFEVRRGGRAVDPEKLLPNR
jgi:lipoprotein NlpD